jgi:hypothetical protein
MFKDEHARVYQGGSPLKAQKQSVQLMPILSNSAKDLEKYHQ